MHVRFWPTPAYRARPSGANVYHLAGEFVDHAGAGLATPLSRDVYTIKDYEFPVATGTPGL